MYRWFLRPLLFLLSAERAHHLGCRLLHLVHGIPGAPLVLRWLFGAKGKGSVFVLGKEFSHPVGLAAGFDKNGEHLVPLSDLGFSFLEVGTVTGEPQPGNVRPRMFRLPRDRAVINRMGFNNEGAAAVALRLRRYRGKYRDASVVIGVNIGKTKRVPLREATADYEKSARLLGPLADYLVVNVSSPNTPGLRDLQAVESLGPLLTAVRDASGTSVPLLVKIAPDLCDEDVASVAALVNDLDLAGVVATNTTVRRGGLWTDAALVEAIGPGGLSGAPLRERSLEVLRVLRRNLDQDRAIISVGGVEAAEDVRVRLAMGANLVQVYTSFVYEGPALVRRLLR